MATVGSGSSPSSYDSSRAGGDEAITSKSNILLKGSKEFDAAMQEQVGKFECRGKEYVITKVGNPLGKGANGVVHEIFISRILRDSSGEIIGIKEKTFAGKYATVDYKSIEKKIRDPQERAAAIADAEAGILRATEEEFRTLEVLHGGGKEEGICVSYTKITLVIDGKGREVILLKKYDKSLDSLLRDRPNIKDKERLMAYIFPNLLTGFKRVIVTNTASGDIKSQNVFGRSKIREGEGIIDAVLADKGQSPVLPTTLTFDNIKAFDNFFMSVTADKLGLGMTTLIHQMARKISDLGLEANTLRNQSLSLIKESDEKEGQATTLLSKGKELQDSGEIEAGQILLDQAKSLLSDADELRSKSSELLSKAESKLAEAQKMNDKFFPFLRTFEKNLMAVLLFESLFERKPFHMGSGMFAGPIPHSVAKFKQDLPKLLSDKGLDQGWVEIFDALLTEIPHYDEVLAYMKEGISTTSDGIPFVSDINGQQAEELIDLSVKIGIQILNKPENLSIDTQKGEVPVTPSQDSGYAGTPNQPITPAAKPQYDQ